MPAPPLAHMAEDNPYNSPLTAGEPVPPQSAPSIRVALWRCVLQGAVIAVFGSIPLAGVVALLFRFPIPFAGYKSGPHAMVQAMVAAGLYGLIGGAVVPAVLGSIGGIMAYVLSRQSTTRAHLLTLIFGLLCALRGLLTLAVLDWVIGPW
jgi:hypothetical protein